MVNKSPKIRDMLKNEATQGNIRASKTRSNSMSSPKIKLSEICNRLHIKVIHRFRLTTALKYDSI